MARSLKRSIGFATFGAPFVLVLTLAACGGDEDASLGTRVEIKPSSFVTTPSTTTPPTAAPGEATGEPGDTSPTEQVYVVEQGDFLAKIAGEYDVTVDELIEYNGWSDGTSHNLFPDDQVRIPPGAAIPSPDDDEEDEETESTDEAESETAEEDESDLEMCPNGEPRGTYTIKETDTTRTGVAERLNVTVDQLDEANANTPGYSGFFPGLKILVPCGGESETTEE